MDIARLIRAGWVVTDAILLCVYFLTFANWDWSGDRVIKFYSATERVPLLIFIVCGVLFLVARLLSRFFEGLVVIESSVMNSFLPMLVFTQVFYFANALFFPRHELRVRDQMIEYYVDDWVKVAPVEAEKVLRQNIRHDVAVSLFLVGIVTLALVYLVSSKQQNERA